MTEPFGKKDYEILQTEILYQGVFGLVRYHIRHRLFKGGWSETFLREVFIRLPAVAVLPYDPILDRVILIEQFRPGAITPMGSPWQIEIPAGVIGKNEKPVEVAIRETKEESGCAIFNLELIYDYFVSPGGSNEYLHIFCGQVDANCVEGVYGLAHEHEDIRVLNISREEALLKLHTNKIKNAPAIISLQWLEINREQLQKKWR